MHVLCHVLRSIWTTQPEETPLITLPFLVM
eukprot:SAG11_NODE_33397_length_277_cov_1.168539_1_plen_29_part_10